jgi:hypothetical protein
MPRPAMSEALAALSLELRCGVNSADLAPTYQALFEQWLCRDRWRVANEAIPLLVGVAPENWSAYVAANGLSGPARRLTDRLTHDLGCATDELVDVEKLGAWSRAQGFELPGAFERVLEFIVSVVPRPDTAPDHESLMARANERERLLGAALALVTRFPQQCRNADGAYDGKQLATVLMEKAVVWFPLAAPEMSVEEIASLFESYLG